MIKVSHLSKKYKDKLAVNDLSFEVETGKVTGFLGPNGAGKSTTMRLMLGLDNGIGVTTYDGKRLHEYAQPSKVVGVLLEAKAFHPTRSARAHLKVLAAEGNIPTSRVAEVLEIVGLSDVARKKPGKFSLGMSQRLGIAAAILGKPKYLILDEPANGLDPEGIAWLREFIRDYAKDGNGVLVSSHLLSEMALMADNVVVIGQGKLIADTSIEKLTASGKTSVFIRVSSLGALEAALNKAKLKFSRESSGLVVENTKTDAVGKIAHSAKVAVFELTEHKATLEDVFLEITEGAAEYKTKEADK